MSREFGGAGSAHQLNEAVDGFNPDKILIVSGKRSYETSGAKEIIEHQLKDYTLLRFCDFEENPNLVDLMKGVQLTKQFKPDLIVAAGGGSVMDMAKMISILPENPEIARKIVLGEEPVPAKTVPIIMIPTTSGSGSEATKFAVVYLNDSKYSILSEGFLPDAVFLDPELTYSLSPYQTAVSGMDALCQAVESYWASRANQESREYASRAIKLVLRSMKKSVNDPDSQSRHEMLIAANLAGKAINITRTTASHAMSYALTTFYDIPHGHAVALTLGEFLLFNEARSDRASSAASIELKQVMKEIFVLFGCKSGIGCRDQFYDLMESIGLNTKLAQMVSGEIDIAHLVKEVNIERLSNHPIPLTAEDVESIYQKILK
jgi:alcohol dehydrogenase